MDTCTMTSRVVECRISEHERTDLERTLNATPDVYADPAAAMRWLQRNFSARCSPELIDAIMTMKTDPTNSGILLVRNGPQAALPSTPLNGDSRGTLLNTIPQAFLAGVMLQLGHPICESSQKRAALIADIVPRPGFGQSVSNAGFGKALDLHVEDVHLPPGRRPTYVGLFCVRPDPEDRAETFVVDIRDALSQLDENVLRELRLPNFVIRQSMSFVGGPACSDPLAILSGPDDLPEVCAEFNTTMPLTPAARAAFDAFQQEVRAVAQSIRLQAGDLLVVCNRRVMHGRGCFEPKFEGGRENRWLLRLSVVADPFSIRDDVAAGGFRILSIRAAELRDLVGITAAAAAKIRLNGDVLTLADSRAALSRYDRWLNEHGGGPRPFADAPRLELALFVALEIAQQRLLGHAVLAPVSRIALATALVYQVEQEARMNHQGQSVGLPNVSLSALRTTLEISNASPELLMKQVTASDEIL